jgi:hypothetical protein
VVSIRGREWFRTKHLRRKPRRTDLVPAGPGSANGRYPALLLISTSGGGQARYSPRARRHGATTPTPCHAVSSRRCVLFACGLFIYNTKTPGEPKPADRQNVTDWTGAQQPGFRSLNYVLKGFYRKKNGSADPLPPPGGPLSWEC